MAFSSRFGSKSQPDSNVPTQNSSAGKSTKAQGKSGTREGKSAEEFAIEIGRVTLALLVFFLLVFGAIGATLAHSVHEGFTIASAAALISLASACLGTLLGFTFAIPRALQSNDVRQDSKYARYIANTNFEQISDWLTKILVGISLVQIGKLPAALGDLGRTLKPMLGNSDIGAGIGVAMCLSATVAAFLLSYLWTRITFTWVLEATGREIEDTVKAVVEDRENNDAEALLLVQQQLSGTANVSAQTLADALKRASKTVLVQAYSLADLQRRSTWQNGPREEHDRVVPVFQALAKCDPELKDQVLYGSLGFALKDQANPDLAAAIDALTTAIDTPGPKRGLELYHWNRALCRIKIEKDQGPRLVDPTLDALIKPDLVAAKSLGKKFYEPLPDSDDDIKLVYRWLEVHDLNFDTLS
jgi:hypothetical protein